MDNKAKKRIPILDLLFKPPTDCKHCVGVCGSFFGNTYMCDISGIYPIVCDKSCENYDVEK